MTHVGYIIVVNLECTMQFCIFVYEIIPVCILVENDFGFIFAAECVLYCYLVIRQLFAVTLQQREQD